MHRFRRSRRPSCRRLVAGSGLALLLVSACAEEADEPTTEFMASVVPYQGFDQGFYLPVDDLVLVDTGGLQVVANGNVALSFAGSQFDGSLDQNDQLDDFEADIGLNGAVTLEISVEGAGDLASELDLFTLALPGFPIGPVDVTPFAKGRLLLTGTADADARMSMVAPFRASGSFSDDASPPVQSTSTPRFEPELGQPELTGDFEGTVQLEVTMVFLCSIGGFPVGGPVLGPRVGVTLEADTMNWNIDGEVQLVGGWAFPDAAGLPVLPAQLDELVSVPPWSIASGSIAGLGPSTRWSQVYDVLNDDDAGAAALFGDRVVVVETEDQPWLAALDDGVPAWQKEGSTGWNPKSVVRAQNGDVLVAGVSSGNDDIRVERYDAVTGSARWTTTMTVPGAVVRLCPPQSVRCDGILPTSSNGAIVSAQVTYPNGTPRLLFASIDRLGNIVWSNELEMGAGSSSPVVHALAESPAGEILAVGTVVYSDGGVQIDGKNALVLRLDGNGNAVSARAVGGLHDQEANQLAVHADGSYAIAGDAGAFAAFEGWIATLDSNDSLVWSGSYQSRSQHPGVDVTTVTGLSAVPGRGLLVSGTFGTPDPDAWIMRVNRDGMPVWVKSYVATDEKNLVEVHALPDGLVAFGDAGLTETNGSYTDLWLLRTSVDGMLDFIDNNGFDTENTDAQWARFAAADHTVHTLAPASVATSTLTGTPSAYVTNVAGAIGELLTD